MKVRFKIEESNGVRTVTCHEMPGFEHRCAVGEPLTRSYRAFADWFENTFETNAYYTDDTTAMYVDVVFKVIGDGQ